MLKTIIVASLAALLQLGPLPHSTKTNTVIFNHIQDRTNELDTVVHDLLGKKFKVVDFNENEHIYSAPVLRVGTIPKAPVMPNGTLLSGYVLIVYVVTDDGRATEAMAVMETDPRLTNIAISAMKDWRYQPGRLDGKTISTTAAYEFEF